MTVQIHENNVPSVNQFDEEQIRIIKETICKGATNDELAFFLQVCKKNGLDPFSRQIYSVPRGGQRTIQVGIDGLRLIADRTGRYVPGKEASYTYDKSGAVHSATAYIKKQVRDGSWHEISATAYWNEYNAGQGLWKKMPHLMLAKCAEALALRKAFPADMSGLYIKEEMEQADYEILDGSKKGEEKPNVKRLDIVEQKDEPKLPVEVKCPVVTKEQAEELKALHDKCEAEYRQSVLEDLQVRKIAGWSKVPADLYEPLKKGAIENIAQYEKAVQAEFENVEGQ